MPTVNYGCSSSRTTPGVITIQEFHTGGKTQDSVIQDNLKRQNKSRTLYTCRLFLLTRIFQYISNWSKVFEHLPTPFFNIHRLIIFPNLPR